MPFTEEEKADDNAFEAKREGSAAGALAPGEVVSHTVEAKLKRFDKADKSWKDMSTGTFTVTLPSPGPGKSARWAFAPPASNPIIIARLDKYASVEAAPNKKDGKHGGVKLTCMARTSKSADAPTELSVFLVITRTAAEQEATVAAISGAKSK